MVVSLLVGAALVAVIVDVPLLARLTDDYDETGAALVLVRFLVAVPVGALVGGWSIRRARRGARSRASGSLLAAVGLGIMSRWGLARRRGTRCPRRSSSCSSASAWGWPSPPSTTPPSPTRRPDGHGVASSLVVVARMVGMVVGLALLTSIGLNRYYDAVRLLPDPLDTAALIGAGVVQVQTVFLGGAVAAGVGALVAFSLGGRGAGPAGVTAAADGVGVSR